MKLKAYLLLLTIALLTYSKSYATNSILSTGGEQDSALVSIEDLRKANIKMTQLKYAKQEIILKDSIIKVDSVYIEKLKKSNIDITNKAKTYKVQRNTVTSISVLLLGIIIGIVL
uniref:Hemolysin XhlA n=1 Tax=Geladintestivirus 1 TaxID=3233133 RepID=A0AAU8MIB3_9CAUD